MKKILTTFLVLIFSIAFSKTSLFSNKLKPDTNINLASNSQEKSDNLKNVLGVNKPLEFKVDDRNILVSFVKVEKIDNLKLIANFSEKLTHTEAKEKYNCQTLVNGGFYTTDYKPTGMFISQYQQMQGFKKSALANGVLSVNDFATPRITPSVPKDRLRIALQNGPLLIENDAEKKLAIKNDTPARRIVAAVTGTNELYFISLSETDSSFMGPKLIDTPTLLTRFEKEINIDIADAINLDGGNASVFISKETNLSSSTLVGSYFCEGY